MITRTVTPSESGKRLHRYLRTLIPNIPLGQIYKMIDQGKVRVNGKRKNQNYELAAGDELSIFMEEEAFKQGSAVEKKVKFAGVSTQIDVIYEDSELLAVNKPVGQLTHPDQAEQKDTLINQVHAYLHKKGELDSRLFLPASANRLDRNTSGLVLVGKTAGMLHQLNQWIQKHELEKFYLTIVEGRLQGSGTISGMLVRDERSNRTLVVGSKGAEAGGAPSELGKPGGSSNALGKEKSAVTNYRAITSGGGYTLVEVELVSGRTHQIRTHFQSIGHPLLGDLKYGGRAAEVNHQLLHAWKIVLPDGRSFKATLPAPFSKALRSRGIAFSLNEPN